METERKCPRPISNGMKIALLGVGESEKNAYLTALEGLDLVFLDEVITADNVSKIKDAEIVSLFVDSTVDKNALDSLPNLRFLATRSTGYDHIDVEYAKEKDIKVSNVPGYGAHTVAEFAFGLLLNLSRKILYANKNILESNSLSSNPTMGGFELSGKTLGVIGTGRIGKTVIRIASGFGMKVLAYDPYPDTAFAKEMNFEYKSLNDVLSGADIVTLHAPYTESNHHLINRENIALMKRGVYFINTARGELVDTEALVWGLKEGIIVGAGLDVLEEERIMKNSNKKDIITELNKELIKMPNVIVTPHIAFFTKEAITEIDKVTIDNIKSFLAGAPINLVG